MNEPGPEPSTESEADNAPSATRVPSEPNAGAQALVFALVAWMVPGLAHVFLRRWNKAAAFFGVVAVLIVLGSTMRGNVFAPGSDGSFGTLGFFADIGSGAFYFLAGTVESPRADLSTAAGDYGTRFIAAAGILNVLAVIDAFETAAHRKN